MILQEREIAVRFLGMYPNERWFGVWFFVLTGNYVSDSSVLSWADDRKTQLTVPMVAQEEENGD